MGEIVKPAVGRNPDVNQIYPIVNSIFEQMTGRTDLEAVDTASLVAMGQSIINTGKLDLWFNTLARRIGLTIDSYRTYTNKFADLYRTQMEWGAYVQKLTVEMPEATADMTYEIGKMDGQSVDQYIINNPKIHQRIFDKETPFSFFITTSVRLLKDAFLSSEAMQSLLSQVMGKVKNKIEMVLEELARIAVCNFILNTKDPQRVHLLSDYNTLRGTSLTPLTARFDKDFLTYTLVVINTISDKLETASVLYNSDKFDRFTNREDQRLYILADFYREMESYALSMIYHEKYLTAKPNIKVPYWQGSGTATNLTSWDAISSIKGTVISKNASVEANASNVVAMLFDRDAIGTFRQEEDVLTTPVNARARYYNTFWHEKQLWFNDMSENGVIFLLD